MDDPVIYFQGPELPAPCHDGSIVTAGQGVILLGCSENSDTLYRLVVNESSLEWKTMPIKLQYPRDSTVAMLIPDELANCNKK